MPNAPCPVVSRLTVSRLPRGRVFGYPCDAASAAAYGRLPEWPKGTVCKTVGSAYVGSNPTPATTCENGPLAAETRPGGPFPSCHAMYQGVSPRVDAWQCPRTYSGQRPGKTSGSYNRSLDDPRPFCPFIRAPGLLVWVVHAVHPCGPVLRRSARAGRRAGLVRTCGGAGLPDRRRHPIDAATEAVAECASPAAGWKTGTVPCERRCWRIWTLHERGVVSQGVPGVPSGPRSG
jgi:hypothetical protein